jgi:hypothetical protein
VRGANQEREALPVTSDEKGRCRLHGAANGSDGPPGERWQYRHGERDQGRDCGAAEIQRVVENAPRRRDVTNTACLVSCDTQVMNCRNACVVIGPTIGAANPAGNAPST